jgi:hypothetical protein
LARVLNRSPYGDRDVTGLTRVDVRDDSRFADMHPADHFALSAVSDFDLRHFEMLAPL